MISSMERAIIKKDLLNITSSKRMFSVLLIVPLMLCVVMPSIFIFAIAFTPIDSPDFQSLLEILPSDMQAGDLRHSIVDALLSSILPIFFLIIPIMAASVTAAGSFVGEKEKRTLETLLYCPLSLKQIFRAKILASFILSMIVSLVSFAAMALVVELELIFTMGSPVMPNINWLIIMLLASPALSLIAITIIVRGSAKAQTFEESQQRSVFLILPIIILIVGQFTGVLMVGAWLLMAIGVVLAVIAFLAVRGAFGKFNYETLLK